jgi:Mn-containing catalase
MSLHDERLQSQGRPTSPEPPFAERLREALGGQYDELSVVYQRLSEAWNCRATGRYRDATAGLTSEEVGFFGEPSGPAQPPP